jgi:hypothetical protein
MGVKKEKKVVSSVFGRVYASGKKFPSKRQSVREKKKTTPNIPRREDRI